MNQNVIEILEEWSSIENGLMTSEMSELSNLHRQQVCLKTKAQMLVDEEPETYKYLKDLGIGVRKPSMGVGLRNLLIRTALIGSILLLFGVITSVLYIANVGPNIGMAFAMVTTFSIIGFSIAVCCTKLKGEK
ncbi:MAG: hypothetical protein WC087_03975 [Candidatus Paceibacterota bacterium]